MSLDSWGYEMVPDPNFSERRLISLTDIKGDNIFQEIGDKTRLDRYVQAEMENPSPRKFADDYPIYRSRPLEPASELGILQLGDFGASAQGDQPRNGRILQPGLYRSPEVVLKKEWNYPVDVWNLAAWVSYT
jgi:serine/threonine-protein kinase SRPK3